jgi:hypothetical protein
LESRCRILDRDPTGTPVPSAISAAVLASAGLSDRKTMARTAYSAVCVIMDGRRWLVANIIDNGYVFLLVFFIKRKEAG